MKTLNDYDRWLTAEIEAFAKTELYARKHGLLRLQAHSGGCRDTYLLARAVFRTTCLPDSVEAGEVIMSYVAQKMARQVHE